jgi:8-oxo-dGTP pyrophosphatase MutT (NUDIX family)
MDFARRSAACILRDEEGRILLQHRDKNIKRFPNCWGFFGGGIEEGGDTRRGDKKRS